MAFDAPPFEYSPDHVPAPGALLQRYLDAWDMSAREFSRRCGRSSKLIVEILSGKASIEPETALQFERVLDMPAYIWLQYEANYRLHLAQQEDAKNLQEASRWTEQFPIEEMRARNVLPHTRNSADLIQRVLKFFGAGSIDACNERFAELASVSYRHSPAFKSHEGPLLVWLRMGELAAQRIECEDYDKAKFLKALRKIRTLTTETIEIAAKAMETYCAQAGVAFVIVKPIEKTAVSGISRWLSPRKGLIQQSLRYMSNDHFWFTFFHEAAHLLLHSRKTVFLDGQKIASGNSKEETEANDWSANFLVPRPDFNEFVATFAGTADEVHTFAREQGIDPGIVVGQLQKACIITYHSKLNHLKRRYVWKTPTA